MTRPLLLAGTLAVLAACTPAAPVHDMAADVAAVGKVRDAYATAFNAGNADAVGALYAADGNSMESMQPTLTGPSAIAAANKAMMDQMASAKVTITAAQTEVSGNMAYDQGTYQLVLTPKTGAATTEDGRYLVVLKRQADGSWRIADNMGNLPAMPAAMMPAPAKKK